MNIVSIVQQTVKAYPAIRPHLLGRARYISALGGAVDETKTQAHYLRQIWDAVKDLYSDGDTGNFIDTMAGVIEEQLTKAFREALRENDMDAGAVSEEPYATALEEMILSEFDFVDGFAGDIAQARKDEAGFEQFRGRAEMWSNRYKDAKNRANALIAEENGDNLIWIFGDTDHCNSCRQLDGIVAKASTWDELGVKPQSPPNDFLDCGGYRCQCTLSPTTKRQSPKAYDLILNAVTK